MLIPINPYLAHFQAGFHTAGVVLTTFAGWLWAVLNTNFSAALFGALGGALAAHAIAIRTERRKRIREEIGGVNTAIALANTITNAFVALKRQHVVPMGALYRQEFEKYVAVQMAPPSTPTEFSFIIDFRDLDMPDVPIHDLRRVLLDRVPTAGAALSIAAVMSLSLAGLARVLSSRRTMGQALQAMPIRDRMSAYFGLANDAGHLDTRVPDQLNGIVQFVDDGIYFPMLICEVLTQHGLRLRKEFGRRPPMVSKITYKPDDVSGLMPDRSLYPDFESNYRKPPNAPGRKWMAWLRA